MILNGCISKTACALFSEQYDRFVWKTGVIGSNKCLMCTTNMSEWLQRSQGKPRMQSQEAYHKAYRVRDGRPTARTKLNSRIARLCCGWKASHWNVFALHIVQIQSGGCVWDRVSTALLTRCHSLFKRHGVKVSSGVCKLSCARSNTREAEGAFLATSSFERSRACIQLGIKPILQLPLVFECSSHWLKSSGFSSVATKRSCATQRSGLDTQ